MHPKDSKFSNWLEWFCEPDNHRTPKPFNLDNGWTAATDGSFAVIFKENFACPVLEWSKIDKIKTRLQGAMDRPAIHEQVISDLSMFGQFEQESCDVCRGNGAMPHYCGCNLCEAEEETCRECGGTGKVTECRPVALWGYVYDANRIAYILEHAPKAASYLFRIFNWTNKDQDKILAIITENWYACLCGLQAKEKVPELILQSEKTGLSS